MVTFSIVIPCHNRSALVAGAVRSVLRQSYDDFEVIVVDDGSEEDLGASIGRMDGRLRLIRQPRRGAAAARNKGVAASQGSHVAFLDSDDLFVPDKLRVAAGHLRRMPDRVIFSQVAMDYGEGVRVTRPRRGPFEGEPMPDYLIRGSGMVPTPSLVLPRALALAVPWNESLGYGDDTDYAIRLWRHGARFVFIPEVLAMCDNRRLSARLSLSGDHGRILDWIEAERASLDPRTYRCYRATHLVALGVRRRPLRAVADVAAALATGSVSLTRALQSLARGLLPPKAYRRLLLSWLKHEGGART